MTSILKAQTWTIEDQFYVLETQSVFDLILLSLLFVPFKHYGSPVTTIVTTKRDDVNSGAGAAPKVMGITDPSLEVTT